MSRRVQALLAACVIAAAPAAVLRGLCAGRSCERAAQAVPRVPFCSLPPALRADVRNGFRVGRSPEVLAVARRTPGVVGESAFGPRLAPEWPSSAGVRRARAPVAFWSPAMAPGALPASFGLDDVAPTLAAIVDLRRPHPEVRSGTPVEDLWAGPRPRLVVEVALEGIGSPDVAAQPTRWPTLERLLRRGVSAPAAAVGSLPLDPAATLTTIGTGGLPRQHGITGTLVRNDAGRLVRAWGTGAPPSVIATLADDLERAYAQRPRVGLVAPDVAYRGLIGKHWYPTVDHDDVFLARGRAAQVNATIVAERAVALLHRGYGDDGVPDLLAVVLRGPAGAMDRSLNRVERALRRAGRRGLLVVTATGSAPPSAPGGAEPLAGGAVAKRVEARVGALARRPSAGRNLVEATAAGGLFVDQRLLARRRLSEDVVVRALEGVRAGPRPVFVDEFPAIAVSFARYC